MVPVPVNRKQTPWHKSIIPLKRYPPFIFLHSNVRYKNTPSPHPPPLTTHLRLSVPGILTCPQRKYWTESKQECSLIDPATNGHMDGSLKTHRSHSVEVFEQLDGLSGSTDSLHSRQALNRARCREDLGLGVNDLTGGRFTKQHKRSTDLIGFLLDCLSQYRRKHRVHCDIRFKNYTLIVPCVMWKKKKEKEYVHVHCMCLSI